MRVVTVALVMAAWTIDTRPAAAQGIPDTFASAVAIDTANHTITLPLFRGHAPGRGPVLFILTESSDFEDAVARGINWSPKLRNALGTAAVQYAHVYNPSGRQGRFDAQHGIVQFAASVDFSGTRLVVPGPDLFPLDPSSHPRPLAHPHYHPPFTTH